MASVELDGSGNIIPALGMAVNYTLSADDVQQISDVRASWEVWRNSGNKEGDPYIRFQGNDVSAGGIYPAFVVAIQGTGTVNLKVMLDGDDIAWVTSRAQGADSNEQGAWTEQR